MDLIFYYLAYSRSTGEFETKFLEISYETEVSIKSFQWVRKREPSARINFNGTADADTNVENGNKRVVWARFSIVSPLNTRLAVVDDAPKILLCFQCNGIL